MLYIKMSSSLNKVKITIWIIWLKFWISKCDILATLPVNNVLKRRNIHVKKSNCLLCQQHKHYRKLYIHAPLREYFYISKELVKVSRMQLAIDFLILGNIWMVIVVPLTKKIKDNMTTAVHMVGLPSICNVSFTKCTVWDLTLFSLIFMRSDHLPVNRVFHNIF